MKGTCERGRPAPTPTHAGSRPGCGHARRAQRPATAAAAAAAAAAPASAQRLGLTACAAQAVPGVDGMEPCVPLPPLASVLPLTSPPERYFVLTADSLSYYTSWDSATAVHKKTIRLHPARSVEAVAFSRFDRPHMFVVTFPEGGDPPLYCQAKDADERDDWMGHIQAQMAQLQHRGSSAHRRSPVPPARPTRLRSRSVEGLLGLDRDDDAGDGLLHPPTHDLRRAGSESDLHGVAAECRHEPWFHEIDRVESQRRLVAMPVNSFIVRPSSQTATPALTLDVHDPTKKRGSPTYSVRILTSRRACWFEGRGGHRVSSVRELLRHAPSPLLFPRLAPSAPPALPSAAGGGAAPRPDPVGSPVAEERPQRLMSEADVPSPFLCSISYEIMTDPVMCADGNSCEASRHRDPPHAAHLIRGHRPEGSDRGVAQRP